MTRTPDAAATAAADDDASAGEPAIRVAGLVKVWSSGGKDVRAVDGLDLVVPRGTVFGLLGPNGAGKTTTVEICEGLVQPSAGTVEVLGRTWARDAAALKERIGVSLQETRFWEKQTVGEIVRLFSSLYVASRAVDDVVAAVSLQDKVDARVGTLSGGQRQRLAVAVALAGAPELLFLDEPTTGLDPQSRRSLWDVIRRFRHDGGTALLTTHYMDEAESLCDEVMIVDHGREIARGAPAALVAELGAAHAVEVRARGLAEHVDAATFEALPGVVNCQLDADAAHLRASDLDELLPALIRVTRDADVTLDDLATRPVGLEDVFVHLTGRHLRDGDDS